MLNMTGKKAAPGLPPPRLQKGAVTKAPAKPALLEQGVAAAPKPTPPTTPTADKPAAPGKAAPLAAKPAPAKAQPEPPAVPSPKPAQAAAEAPTAKALPGPRLAEAPAKAQESPASKPTVASPRLAEAPAKQESPASKPTLATEGATATSAGAGLRVPFASQPAGARVWVNGEERGETPCTVPLRPGTARVVLVRPGYLSSQSTLEVREGAKVDVALKAVEPPMTGEARFRAECQTTGKFPIVVDGKETGILCPFSKMRVEPGTHTIGLLIPATGQVHQKEVILFAGVRSVVFKD
jgi:hypothetical protein